MSDPVEKIEKKIKTVAAEVVKLEKKSASARSPQDKSFYNIKKEAAWNELSKLRGDLIIAKAKQNLKKK